MPPRIHPTAIVAPEAELADDVEVGAYAIIEGSVRIGARTRILPYVHISGDTVIGEDNHIHMGAVIGHTPQDLGWKEGTPTGVRIGDGNQIRERVEIHRATRPGENTVLGDGNFIMAGAHIAHDCVLGDRNILANNALLAGHVRLEGRVNIAGLVPVHQFVRIGELAMLWGYSACAKDVPPYMALHGRGRVVGVNLVGMRRAPDIPRAAIDEVKNAFRVLFRSGLGLSAALEELERTGPCAQVRHIIEFCRGTRRGICKGGVRDDVEVE